MAVMWVFWFGVRHAIEVVRVRRLQRAHDGDWDQIIASIKFRLPSRAEFARRSTIDRTVGAIRE